MDINEFTAWRMDGCDECRTVQLVTGPPSGPTRCRDCWYGESTSPRRRPTESGRGDAVLFDAAPYAKRKKGKGE